MKVLVIENEQQIADFIKQMLEHENFHVTVCASLGEAVKERDPQTHDVIILDLMLDDGRGEDLVQAIRKKGEKTPILVLSALNQISTKIDLINMGADDYMVKPFDAQELIARLRALHRRHLETTPSPEEEHQGITFHWKEKEVIREGKTIHLTTREMELLHFLLKNAGRTVTNEEILEKVWQSKIGYQSNVVQSTIRRLRKKLDDGFEEALIQNVHGVGYQIKA